MSPKSSKSWSKNEKWLSLLLPDTSGPSAFVEDTTSNHSTASSFAEGQQQHLLAQRLINWLIRRLRCKLIDWSSCGWCCLYLEPWGAKLWRSPLICHVQHTGEDVGEMKRCGFITETWGACIKEVSAKMGTRGMPREQWEHGDNGAGDERKGEETLQPVDGYLCRHKVHEGRRKKWECDKAKSNNSRGNTVHLFLWQERKTLIKNSLTYLKGSKLALFICFQHPGFFRTNNLLSYFIPDHIPV